MSRSVNRIILVGHVGSDPDVRRTSTGRPVANVSLATNRRFEQAGEMHERTDWHRLTFWAKSAETVERYVRRGTRLYIDGRIEYGSYERDGQSIPTADIVVRDFVFLDPATDGIASGRTDGDDAEASGTFDEEEDLQTV